MSKFDDPNDAETSSHIRHQKDVYRFARYCAFSIGLFAIIILFDKYLPTNKYTEVVEVWDQQSNGGRHARLHSYMKTASFSFEVPHDLLLNYPHSNDNMPKLAIEVTSLFRIPIRATNLLDPDTIWSLPGTIHTTKFPLVWMTLLCSLFTGLRKNYSKLNYSLAFMPMLLLAGVG